MAKAPQTAAASSEPGPAADLTGRRLGDFHVLRCLGQGGMGQVYLAEQISLKRKVALKFLRPDLAADADSLQRFKAEAVARATHANIVQVYAIGSCAGLHYMALEYVEGRNLRSYLEKKGPPDVLLALSIMRQVAAALQRAAELGIIHRDIKPENILLTRKGEVKVADFGLSRCLAGDAPPLKLTQPGVTLGTPLYMSPEQVQGRPVDARTDIYSLGVTCYHMLAGQPPFRSDSPFDVALQHVNTEPVPLAERRPDLPPDLCAVVHKMMAKDPAQRYQSGRELLKELVRLRDGLANAAGPQQTQAVSSESVVESVPAAQPAAPRPPRWLFAAVPVSLGLALAAGAGAALLLRQYRSANVTAAAAPDVSPDDGPVSLRKREQVLKDAVALYATPKDPTQVRLGVGQNVELALFYLDQWRLDDAEQLFTALAGKGEVRPYHLLGRLGQALVLALRSEAAKSNELFLEVTGGGQATERLEGMLKQNPRLRQWVARALDYNATNLPDKFPPALSRLR
jgi:serine/threonine-protein kinase